MKKWCLLGIPFLLTFMCITAEAGISSEEYAFFAESEEAARQISQDYGGEFISYQYGIGVLEMPLKQSKTAVQKVSAGVKVELYPENLYTVELNEEQTQGDEQWHLDVVKAKKAWTITQGEGVTVAVIDTGIDTNHENFDAERIDARTVIPVSAYGSIYEKDYEGVEDYLGHGTHVTGIIGAGNNGIGCTGIAPKCHILAIKALEKSGNRGTGKSSWIAAAIQLAIEESADVINLSMGGTQIEDGLLKQTIKKANEAGIIVVCAAGNITGSPRVFYPGAYEETIAVSAVCRFEDYVTFASAYSNYGEWVDISAPGTAVMSTIPGGYGTKTGTSMSCPIVSGAAALLLSLDSGLSCEDALGLLSISAVDLGESGRDDQYGYGVLDIENLMKVYFSRLELTTPEAEIPGESYIGEGTNICIRTEMRGAQIVYTLDGSEPDENSAVYTAEGMVFGSNEAEILITAKTLSPDKRLSDSKKFHYYIIPNVIKLEQKQGEEASLIPVYGAYIDPVLNIPCRRYEMQIDAGVQVLFWIESQAFTPVIKIFDSKDQEGELLDTKKTVTLSFGKMQLLRDELFGYL